MSDIFEFNPQDEAETPKTEPMLDEREGHYEQILNVKKFQEITKEGKQYLKEQILSRKLLTWLEYFIQEKNKYRWFTHKSLRMLIIVLEKTKKSIQLDQHAHYKNIKTITGEVAIEKLFNDYDAALVQIEALLDERAAAAAQDPDSTPPYGTKVPRT